MRGELDSCRLVPISIGDDEDGMIVGRCGSGEAAGKRGSGVSSSSGGNRMSSAVKSSVSRAALRCHSTNSESRGANGLLGVLTLSSRLGEREQRVREGEADGAWEASLGRRDGAQAPQLYFACSTKWVLHVITPAAVHDCLRTRRDGLDKFKSEERVGSSSKRQQEANTLKPRTGRSQETGCTQSYVYD